MAASATPNSTLWSGYSFCQSLRASLQSPFIQVGEVLILVKECRPFILVHQSQGGLPGAHFDFAVELLCHFRARPFHFCGRNVLRLVSHCLALAGIRRIRIGWKM